MKDPHPHTLSRDIFPFDGPSPSYAIFFAVAVLFLLSLAFPALADNPAMGPYGFGSLPLFSMSFKTTDLAFSSTPMVNFLSRWQQAMQGAGICELHFVGDGSGIRIGIQVPTGCDIGPVISFPEFRRRMEAP